MSQIVKTRSRLFGAYVSSGQLRTCCRKAYGRVVPIPVSCSAAKKRPSLDHLIRCQQQAGRYGQAERLRGLEIEESFELDWSLHRKIGWFGAP